jgi:hypothetical protein
MIDSATNSPAAKQILEYILKEIPKQIRRWFIDLVSIPVELSWQLRLGAIA